MLRRISFYLRERHAFAPRYMPTSYSFSRFGCNPIKSIKIKQINKRWNLACWSNFHFRKSSSLARTQWIIHNRSQPNLDTSFWHKIHVIHLTQEDTLIYRGIWINRTKAGKTCRTVWWLDTPYNLLRKNHYPPNPLICTSTNILRRNISPHTPSVGHIPLVCRRHPNRYAVSNPSSSHKDFCYYFSIVV